jgi:Spy/CpxP family protein refolding chaperone
MLLTVLMLAQVTLAEGKEGHGKLSGWYSHYAKELNMTDEQVAKFTEIVQKKQDAEAKWKQDGQAKFEAAETAYKSAKESGDKDAIAKAKEAYYAARQEKAQASKEFDDSFDALLTPEQKNVKASLGLSMGTVMSLRKANLTEEQKAKIKEMAAADSEAIAALAGSDRKAQGKAKQAFKQKVIDEVLTDEQKTALGDDAKPKTEKPKKEKAEKPKKEKKEKAKKPKNENNEEE